MGKKMLEIDVFRESILKSDAILKPYNIHLYDLLMNSDESSLDDIVNSFVGIAATQVYCYYPFSETKSWGYKKISAHIICSWNFNSS